MNIFELKNLNFAYPMSTSVLKNLNLTIESGEHVCILGANGCGKSTLLKILAGLLSPSSGNLYAFGNKVDPATITREKAKEYHHRVGYVFQDSDVQLFCSNVLEELAFGPLQLGMSQKQVLKLVNEMAESLNITKLLDKPPFHLSGGEKKKVAIASTLILDPEVLIMDEPTNDLDPRSQTWLLKLIQSFGKGKTLIFSTHNLELVPHIADRAILFNESHELCSDIPVRELLSDGAMLRSVNLVDEHFHTHPWDFE